MRALSTFQIYSIQIFLLWMNQRPTFYFFIFFSSTQSEKKKLQYACYFLLLEFSVSVFSLSRFNDSKEKWIKLYSTIARPPFEKPFILDSVFMLFLDINANEIQHWHNFMLLRLISLFIWKIKWKTENKTTTTTKNRKTKWFFKWISSFSGAVFIISIVVVVL